MKPKKIKSIKAWAVVYNEMIMYTGGYRMWIFNNREDAREEANASGFKVIRVEIKPIK